MSKGISCWGASDLARALCATFRDPALFYGDLVTDRRYLRRYRLHARVCGLLARIGIRAGFLVDIGRRHKIDPVSGSRGRRQCQAEADVTFVDPARDEPVALLDYETGDAPIAKMRDKFRYFNSFLKHTRTVRVVSFLVTMAGVQHSWKDETEGERKAFVSHEIPRLVKRFFRISDNERASFIVGVFYPDHLELREFSRKRIVRPTSGRYGRTARPRPRDGMQAAGRRKEPARGILR